MAQQRNFEKGNKKEILFGGKVKKYLEGIYETNETIYSLITFERICSVSC